MKRTIGRRHLGLAAVGVGPAAALAAALALTSVGATAAPTPLVLTFEGAHFPDDSLREGLRHDGRFTASPPLCSAGRAYDAEHLEHLEMEPLAVRRMHVCDDGSGTFTALMPVVRDEHGGTGSWQIVEGTGRYAALRGVGSYRGTLVSGDPSDFRTIVYRTSWHGVVDFDADPPAIGSFTATARKVRSRPRTYAVRIGVRIRDTGTPVSYTAEARSGSAAPAFKRGSTASGQVTFTLRLRAPRTARSGRIVLSARDALGNETTTSRSVRLR